MTTINPNQFSGNKNFKQVEADGWTSIYLPAICAAILMGGVLFFAVSCSKKSDSVAKISAPTQQASSPSASASPAAMPSGPAKKAVKKHRPANATYVNSTYGVSFSYPHKYSLQSGNKLGTSSLQPSFLKAGAVQVAAIDLPDDMYPETDFSSALLNVSVNKSMTEDECKQFVVSKDAGEVKPTTAKLGVNEYSVFEQINTVGDRKSDLKYFHLFKNNACYEFALDVDTTVKADADVAQVDRGKVFQKMEKILTTARIKDLQPTEAQSAQTPAADTKSVADINTTDNKAADGKVAEEKPADSKTSTEGKSPSSTESAQVVKPEPK